MCKKSRELVDYLLLHCEMASALWNIVFSFVGLAWVMPNQVVDLFACWKGQCGRLWEAAMWKMVPLCFMWCIWREKNDRCFEDHEQTMGDLRDFLFSFKTLYLWTTTFDYNISSFNVFLELFTSSI
jgi:hypothetical protein